MGSYVQAFEQALADLLEGNGRKVAAVSTGHAALHLSLMSLGAGPGDEVITPSFNNITDFQAILATGAQPVLCDVDDRTLCLDVARVEELITPRTRP
jgi:dTDP-4-amino-4,6-dideoxygalactose transaminase